MGNLLGCVRIDQSRIAITERFGRFDKVLKPGCHCVPWYLGSKISGHISLAVQQLDVKCETETQDNVFVTVAASIQYRPLVGKAEDAFYKLSNIEGLMQTHIFDVIRDSVPKLRSNDVRENRKDIAKALDEVLQKAVAAYGYEIVETFIVDIELNANYKTEINDAARLRVKAEAEAEAEKTLLIKRAEAEAECKYLSGVGIARQRQAVVDGLAETLQRFTVDVPGYSAKEVVDMVLGTQCLDATKEIGANTESSVGFVPPTADT